MTQASSRTLWISFTALQLAALAGCTQTLGRPETPEERAHSVQAAVYDIVRARCDLETRCGTVGPGQKFEGRPMCESKMQGETAVHLNTADCPLGVDPRKLDVCVTSILAQDCGSLFDALSRWNACRNGQLCYSESTRHL